MPCGIRALPSRKPPGEPRWPALRPRDQLDAEHDEVVVRDVRLVRDWPQLLAPRGPDRVGDDAAPEVGRAHVSSLKPDLPSARVPLEQLLGDPVADVLPPH